MNRALLPLLLTLPLGCRGTFDLDKYADDGESSTMTSATASTNSSSDASETRTDDESTGTGDTTDTTETDTTDTTDTDPDTTDTQAECMVGLIEVGGACIGLKQTLQLGASSPTDLAVADFGNDGWPDLLVAGSPVNYFSGSESGMFGAIMPILEANGTGLAAVDWNVNGQLDFFAVADADFQLFYSSGIDTFSSAVTLVPGGYDAAVGDLDGDGDKDLIITGASLKVLLRDINNNLMQVADLAFPAQRIELANLDSDGNNTLDIAVAMTAMNHVTVILSDGGLGFQALTPTALLSPADVAVANLDSVDGLEVIAVGGEQEGQLLLLNVQGDALAQLGMFDVGGSPRAVAVGDINDDQLTDVAVGNASSHDVSLLLGDRGSLTNEYRLPADDMTDSPESIAVVDLDNDGFAEIIVGMIGSNRVLVYGHMQ